MKFSRVTVDVHYNKIPLAIEALSMGITAWLESTQIAAFFE